MTSLMVISLDASVGAFLVLPPIVAGLAWAESNQSTDCPEVDHPRAGRPAHLRRPPARPGLRREEVALLAGISVDYYTQMERGNLGGVSDSVLDALAQALQLDEAERA